MSARRCRRRGPSTLLTLRMQPCAHSHDCRRAFGETVRDVAVQYGVSRSWLDHHSRYARTTPTTAVATGSTRAARSPCATRAASTQSAPDEPTPDPRHRPGPRPRHPHHRRSHRRTTPRTRPRPDQALPVTPPSSPHGKHRTAEPAGLGLGRPRCLETSHPGAARTEPNDGARPHHLLGNAMTSMPDGLSERYAA